MTNASFPADTYSIWNAVGSRVRTCICPPVTSNVTAMKKTFITLITLCTASTAPLFGASTLISSFDFEGTNWWDDAQGAASINNTTPLTLNTWHHVAVSFMDNADNPGTYSITAYVDGSVYGTGTSNMAAVWDSHVSLHEQNDNCTQRFRGGVDDLLFYKVDTNDDVLQPVSAQSARIPEPATATLSLVALGAMALHRRRTA